MDVAPEELPTPSYVLNLMSLKLQMLSRRLDGDKVLYAHSPEPPALDPFVVLRLCERHSLLAMEEVNYIYIKN